MWHKLPSVMLIVYLCAAIVAICVESTGHSFTPAWLFPLIGGLILGCSATALRNVQPSTARAADYLRPPLLDPTLGSALGIFTIIIGWFYL